MKRMMLLVLAVVLMASSALAAETKIGYLDMQRALNTSEAGKAAKDQLQDKLKKYQEQINVKQADLTKLKNDLEKQGIFFAVIKAEVRYKAPARYDDELTLITRLIKSTHVRYDHTYVLKRGHLVLAEGLTTIACVDRNGELQQIPEWLNQPRQA